MIPFFSLWIFFTLRELAYNFVTIYNYNVSHFELGFVASPIDRMVNSNRSLSSPPPKEDFYFRTFRSKIWWVYWVYSLWLDLITDGEISYRCKLRPFHSKNKMGRDFGLVIIKKCNTSSVGTCLRLLRRLFLRMAHLSFSFFRSKQFRSGWGNGSTESDELAPCWWSRRNLSTLWWRLEDWSEWQFSLSPRQFGRLFRVYSRLFNDQVLKFHPDTPWVSSSFTKF